MSAVTAQPKHPMPFDDDENIPKAPPQPLRNRYIKISWQYVFWCLGMLIWATLCVVYFVLTRQREEMWIAVGLGVILLSMVAGPAFLFGGETWYKRLAWMVVLLSMFSLMWVYPMIAAVTGVARRWRTGRYVTWQLTDIWHASLCVFTVVLAVWTFWLTFKVVKMTRQLARGEFGEMDIRVREA